MGGITGESQELFAEKRQETVIEKVCGSYGDLNHLKLGKSHAGVGIEGRLLIDPTVAFQIADIIRILGDEIARMLCFDLFQTVFPFPL